MKIDIQKKEKILDGAQKVFFEALLDGYAGGDNKKSVKTSDANGCKTITFVSDNYKVVDQYYVTPASDFSTGTTIIFYKYRNNWMPVWYMAYGGRYPKLLIGFLKESLKKNYEVKIFNGGRGPSVFHSKIPGLSYENQVNGNFKYFSGEEKINSSLKIVGNGYHRYFGMSMI